MNAKADEFATVAEPGSHDYYTLLFAPAARRETLRALLVIEALLMELSTAPIDQQVRNTKLGWWAEELARYEAGNPNHPVMRLLCDQAPQHEQVISPLRDLFFAVAREATEDLPDTPVALLEHAGQGGAIVGSMAMVLADRASATTLHHPTLVALARARYLVMRFGPAHQCQAGDNAAGEHAQLLNELATKVYCELGSSLGSLERANIRHWRPLVVMAALLRGPLVRLGHQQPARRGSFGDLLLGWRSARRAARGKLLAWPPLESLQ